MPHYLRTGEKTYSVYYSPLVPENYERSNDVNGDEKYTSDGRIIYDSKNGVFDVSYSAAFEIGRMITLSHRAEAEKINLWRKEQAVSEHIKKLDAAIGTRRDEFEELCIKLVQGDKI
jgi:hypothetical protein